MLKGLLAVEKESEKARYKAPKVWIVLLDVNAGEMSTGVMA